mmetsp:Transcript_12640/g.19598  ORF Transcript_12640/g.19598 Transcript_12640/m.19598 type:complete len:417 (-) Transcript_12640:159-1409(-)
MPAPSKPAPSKEALRKAGGDYARKQVNAMFAKSRFEDYSNEFPKFERSELQMGKLLGKGGFCTVNEIRAFHVAERSSGSDAIVKKKKHGCKEPVEEDDEVEDGGMEGKQFIADHCIRNGGDSRYAVKFISKENIEDVGMFIQAIKDMAVETRFLSTIEHPNIIKMRAIGATDPFDEQYFIAMDRLYDTLEGRLEKWGKRMRKQKSGIFRSKSKKELLANELEEEKLVFAFDLAAALEYLHARNIVYRDLKPENIGFDVRGDIKIFDFGLAKEILPEYLTDNELYKLSGDTGSMRYMAPEVAREEPYNFTVDTYGFAIVFWQMLTCRVPFEHYNMKLFREKVHRGEMKRPVIDDSWSTPVKLLLKRGWSNDISERHNMLNVVKILKKECTRVRGGDTDGLEHLKRRSTYVFRPTAKA